LFASWDASDWLILVVDIVAVIIVVMFLRRKIRHKIEEVETRQAHRIRMNKSQKATPREDPPLE